MIINKFILSHNEPTDKSVGWIIPISNGTYKIKVYGSNGWADAASGIEGPQGPQGNTGAQGPAGADGKSITAIALTTDETGKVIGGTATLTGGTTIQITITSNN